jgi:hypothetical protein
MMVMNNLLVMPATCWNRKPLLTSRFHPPTDLGCIIEILMRTFGGTKGRAVSYYGCLALDQLLCVILYRVIILFLLHAPVKSSMY